MDDLISSLEYVPQELRFGTSGRRGLVADLTQLEVYMNALAEIEYLQSLAPDDGGIEAGDEFFFGYDLRPSSTSFVAEQKGRGEIAQAIERAIRDSGMKPVNLGCIPTPALTFYALSKEKGSIMVTGSHIPFDRNGYKTNTSRGELLKEHEGPINQFVQRVRDRIYCQSLDSSIFDTSGRFKTGHCDLSRVDDAAREAYIERYERFFACDSLRGMKLFFYQHSAVGRDLVPEILERLGAEVIPVGRSDRFVPIDTENIDSEQLETIQALAHEATARYGKADALISTDGDSDRPLVLGMDANSKVQFYSGDLVGMITAGFLGAEAIVVPITCNDAIDWSDLAHVLEAKTRIGSPYVIAGMNAALAKGRKTVCGWEANGGFLTASSMVHEGRTLTALPTRDAMLPILCTLVNAREKKQSLNALFARLPRRFSCAALLKQFPRAEARRIVESYSPSDRNVSDAAFEEARIALREAGDTTRNADKEHMENLLKIRDRLSTFFGVDKGFGEICRLNYTDGVRICFSNGDVAHIRPSGNADELRIYAVSDTKERAQAIVAMGIAEPNGILRSMERVASRESALH